MYDDFMNFCQNFIFSGPGWVALCFTFLVHISVFLDTKEKKKNKIQFKNKKRKKEQRKNNVRKKKNEKQKHYKLKKKNAKKEKAEFTFLPRVIAFPNETT